MPQVMTLSNRVANVGDVQACVVSDGHEDDAHGNEPEIRLLCKFTWVVVKMLVSFWDPHDNTAPNI